MTSDVPLETLSHALDEIYQLRAGIAHEAQTIEMALRYRTLPGAVRIHLEGILGRLRQAARGEFDEAWTAQLGIDRQAALISAGARPTLTRSAWESERA